MTVDTIRVAEYNRLNGPPEIGYAADTAYRNKIYDPGESMTIGVAVPSLYPRTEHIDVVVTFKDLRDGIDRDRRQRKVRYMGVSREDYDMLYGSGKPHPDMNVEFHMRIYDRYECIEVG